MENQGQTACLPTLSLFGLLVLRSRLGPGTTVYYDEHGLFGRKLSGWLKVPSRRIEKTLMLATGLKVHRIPRHDDSPAYPRLTLEAMRKVLNCCAEIDQVLKTSHWVQAMACLLGEEPARASFLRQLAWLEIWPRVSAAMVCRGNLPGEKNLTLLWDPSWPETWTSRLEKAFAGEAITLIKWPRWRRSIGAGPAALFWTLRLLLLTAASLARQGVRWRRVPPINAVLTTEFVDPARIGGTPVDADYWIDGKLLKKEDVVFFLTRAQTRHLARAGVDARAALAGLRERGFRTVDLAKASFSSKSLREILRMTLRMLPKEPFLARTFFLVWKDCLDYLLLTDSVSAKNLLHTPFPNGNAGPRLDSGVATGLCRKTGTRSVGYQNRCIYDTHFEWAFDCYDLYLSWGDAWTRALGEDGLSFLPKTSNVGCLNNDGLPISAGPGTGGSAPTVSIFTFELYGNHYPKTYTLEMLEACVALAKSHPECRFQVKTKDPGNVDVLLSDARFRKLFESVNGNFSFLRVARFGAAPVVAQSDIVIAQAFSTVGSDALLLGKRVLFYSKLGDSGKPFTGFPDLVAGDPSSLSALFERALADYRDYGKAHAARLAELDPYRDGDARSRILQALLA